MYLGSSRTGVVGRTDWQFAVRSAPRTGNNRSAAGMDRRMGENPEDLARGAREGVQDPRRRAPAGKLPPVEAIDSTISLLPVGLPPSHVLSPSHVVAARDAWPTDGLRTRCRQRRSTRRNLAGARGTLH